MSAVVDLVAGDYVDVMVAQTSTASLNISEIAFWIARLDSGSSAYSGPRWGSGTAFPSGPATNDRFTRTDRGLDYYYDGTRWLTTTLFTTPIAPVVLGGISGTGEVGRAPCVGGVYDMYCTTVAFSYHLGATNDGSNYWIPEVYATRTAGTGDLSIASSTTQSLTASQRHNASVTVNALLGTNVVAFYLYATKVSGASALNSHALVNYRLVG